MKGKRTLALTLGLLMLTSLLAACAPGSTIDGESGSSAASETSSSAGEPAGDKEELVLWNRDFEQWNLDFYTQRVEEYNQLGRECTIKQESVADAVWNERMTAAQASGTAPDMYIISFSLLYSHVKDGMIQPLDGLIPQEGIDDLLPNIKDMVTIDGKVYAYPQLVEPSTILFYRKDLFEQANIAQAPKTWDELVETAKALTTDEVFGLGLPSFNEEMNWASWGWQIAASGHLALNDNWDAPVIDQGYKDLALFYKRLYDEKVVPEQPLSGYTDITAFAEGNLAMTLSGSWTIAQLYNDYPEMIEKVGVAVSPTKDGNQDVTTATNGGWTYVIDANCKNAKGAADYISWLLAGDPEICGEFFEIAHFSKSPPRTSVQAWVEERAGDNDWSEVVNKVAANAVPEPQYPWDLSGAVALMIEEVALGGVDVDTAAANCEAAITEIIENEGLAGNNPNK